MSTPENPASKGLKRPRKVTSADKWYAGAKRDHDTRKKQAFLVAFAKYGIITAAAKEAGISQSLHYSWLERDSEYAAAYALAQKAAVGVLEHSAWCRAVEGQQRVDKDGNIYRQYSDLLLMFLLKKRDNSYRDSVRTEVDVNISGQLQHYHTPRLERLSTQDWLQLAHQVGSMPDKCSYQALPVRDCPDSTNPDALIPAASMGESNTGASTGESMLLDTETPGFVRSSGPDPGNGGERAAATQAYPLPPVSPPSDSNSLENLKEKEEPCTEVVEKKL